MEAILAAALPSILVAALTMYVTRMNRAQDTAASAFAERVKDLEGVADAHAADLARISTTAAVLSIRVDGLHQSDGDLRQQISDILENMARRSDLEALGQRIDDALRRGSSGNHPAPRPRRG